MERILKFLTSIALAISMFLSVPSLLSLAHAGDRDDPKPQRARIVHKKIDINVPVLLIGVGVGAGVCYFYCGDDKPKEPPPNPGPAVTPSNLSDKPATIKVFQ